MLGPAAVGSVLQAGTDLQQLVINVFVPSLYMGMGVGMMTWIYTVAFAR